MAAGTFRSWVIGTIFVGAGSFINQFFSIRYPNVSVGANVAQLLCVSSGVTPHESQVTENHM
jgi:hypothetical protein